MKYSINLDELSRAINKKNAIEYPTASLNYEF